MTLNDEIGSKLRHNTNENSQLISIDTLRNKKGYVITKYYSDDVYRFKEVKFVSEYLGHYFYDEKLII